MANLVAINFRAPKYCGGEAVFGEIGCGCREDEETGVPLCKCIKKPTWNYVLVMALLGEMLIDKLHLSSDIAGDWTRFCIRVSLPGGTFGRYLPMNATVLRKNFKIMMKDFEGRNGLGTSEGFEYSKVVKAVDKRFMRMHTDLNRQAHDIQLKKDMKDEVASSKLYFEAQTLDSVSTEDHSIYDPPPRNVSMLQNKEDGVGEPAGEDVEMSDEEGGSASSNVRKNGGSGYTTFTRDNAPQNG